MDPTDAFFTQTIVGQPFTVLLGRRQQTHPSSAQGLEIDLSTGESQLCRLWHEWIVLNHEDDAPGTPRRRPGRARRRLERHALWLAFLGMTSLVATLAFWGVRQWS